MFNLVPDGLTSWTAWNATIGSPFLSDYHCHCNGRLSLSLSLWSARALQLVCWAVWQYDHVEKERERDAGVAKQRLTMGGWVGLARSVSYVSIILLSVPGLALELVCSTLCQMALQVGWIGR